MICKNCGYDQKDDYKFCLRCGANTGRYILCDECGCELPVEAAFCGGCGKGVDPDAAAVSYEARPVVTAAAAYATTRERGQPAPADAGVYCDNCGSETARGAYACGKCGTPVGAAPPPPPVPPPPVPPQIRQPVYAAPAEYPPAAAPYPPPYNYPPPYYPARPPKPPKPPRPKREGKFHEDPRVKKISHLTAVWFFAGMFLLMFCMSFGGFMKFEISNGFNTYKIRASAIGVVAAAVSPKTDAEAERDFDAFVYEKFSGAQTDKEQIKAINRFGVMKLVHTKEAIEAAPVSARFLMTLYSFIILAMLALSAAFFGISLRRALKLTLTPDPKDYKPIKPGAFFAATGALGLAARLCIGAGALDVFGATLKVSPGAGINAMIWISFAALAALTAFNFVFCGKKIKSLKRFIAVSVSAAAGLVLLISSAAAVTVSYGNYSAGYGLLEGVAAIDNAINLNGGYSLYSQSVNSVLGRAASNLSRGDTAAAMLPLHPAYFAFYEGAESVETANANIISAVASGALSLAAHLLAVVSAALLFARNAARAAGAEVGDESKRRLGSLIFAVIGAAALLSAAGYTASLGSTLYAPYNNAGFGGGFGAGALSVRIGAFTVINQILAIGALAQQCVLFSLKTKRSAGSYASS